MHPVLAKKLIMKNGIIILMMLISQVSKGQTLQTVHGIVKDRQEMSWYIVQEKLWKKEIDANKKNPVAWSNYYEAVRAQYLLTGKETSEVKPFVDKLNKITDDLYALLPDSFEANYLMYRNYGDRGAKEYFKYLQRAFEIDPNDQRVYELFITQYEMDRNESGFHDFCVRYFMANELPSGVYNWAYNMISETDQNAILFTGGDLDTYPIWGLQEAKNIRKDVRVINTYLLLDDTYRTKILAEMGIPPFTKNMSDCKTEEERAQNETALFKHILTNQQNIPVYVASNIVFQFQENFGDNLYMTGLTYKYSAEPIDNISLIRRNYEKKYLLDYLNQSFSFHPGDKMIARVNSTYLPAFLKLYFHYRDGEETEKAETLKAYIIEISRRADCYNDVIKLIEK